MRDTEGPLPADTGMTTAYDWEGRDVIDQNGELVGAITALYAHAGSETPAWAVVTTGLFGMKESFVPIAGAQPTGGQVRVQVTKEDVRGAPRISPGGELTLEEELELYRHYRLEYPEARTPEPSAGEPAMSGAEPAAGGQPTTTR